ncbi:MAG: hypothetical protein LIP01_13340 [Tannerellaceae bacterium]|nr:hypothetical protein [Tannerellaceae bacterium]
MKKITLLYTLLVAMLFTTACDPVENRESLGGIIPASELKIDVYSLEDGGNEIVLVNNTPGVGSFWDYGSGYSSRQQDTIIVPFLGDLTVSFTGISSGGTVTKTETIKVDKIISPVDETWNLLAGTDENGKTWVWDCDDPSDIVWGNGASIVDYSPSWNQVSAAQMGEEEPEVGIDGRMVFDLNQKANFTKIGQDGTVLERGAFQFDMSQTMLSADGETLWSIGQLTIIDGTIFKGISPNGGGVVVNTFEILELTEDKMVLAHVSPGGMSWEAWYWKFRVKK